MSKNIKNTIKKVILESMLDPHYQERLYDRFLNRDVITVGYEIPGTMGEYEIVGEYKIPAAVKLQIAGNAELVEKYNFPKNKSYGIKVSDIPIDKNQVQYFSEELKQKSKSSILVFVDEKTNSNGNVIYAIVRNNTLVTIYFGKNYVSQDANKLRVDFMLKKLDNLRTNSVR